MKRNLHFCIRLDANCIFLQCLAECFHDIKNKISLANHECKVNTSNINVYVFKFNSFSSSALCLHTADEGAMLNKVILFYCNGVQCIIACCLVSPYNSTLYTFGKKNVLLLQAE